MATPNPFPAMPLPPPATTPARALWRPGAPSVIRASAAAASTGCFRVGGRGGRNLFAGLQMANTHLHKCRTAHVKSGEAEGSPRSESIILDEETLRHDLETAIQEEDYAQAAKLRDELRVLQEDSKASVLASNTRFYNAFKNGDLATMHSIWAKGDHVCVVHPSAARISGYGLVMQSWEMVCNADYEYPLQFDLQNIEVHVRGDLGYVTCLEMVKARGSSSWGKQIATNVFEKIDGTWFICIHHASHFDE